MAVNFAALDLGTTYWGIWSMKKAEKTLFKTALPLQLKESGSFVQVVSRTDDSYIGYLGELFNTPFILAPRFIPSVGHQTDLRMGSDCAEFLIYGKRRQKFVIPYCGPRGIISYLDLINPDSLFEGCIIHFGIQTSLLLEDKGVKGILDDEDILLECYERGPEKIAYKNSEFRHHAYKAYKWKSKFE
jgi:hypothetical protein